MDSEDIIRPTPSTSAIRLTVHFYSTTICPAGVLDFQYRVEDVVKDNLLFVAEAHGKDEQDIITKLTAAFGTVHVERTIAGWHHDPHPERLSWLGATRPLVRRNWFTSIFFGEYKRD